MTREDVIRTIVERDIQNRALAAEAVLREAPDLHAAACENFGTWDTAVQYAGISRRRLKVEQEYSRDRVLLEVRRLCQRGYCLQAWHIQRHEHRLYQAGQRNFGGWRQTLRAAGIDVKRVHLGGKPRRLDKQAIIAALQNRHRDGLSLRWSRVCLEDRNLLTAARNAFHGWHRALEAAGLAFQTRRAATNKKWTKELVLQGIRQRQQEGKSLSHNQVRRDECPLLDAARRYFGGWPQALLAAGVKPQPQGRECRRETIHPDDEKPV
ncbi:MAG: hypothetical protein GX575_31125 [Candidatus Anammoximicrobium sp.]|nr:hypothetical protein [Candidatus Anammoximicrobium sp.]